MNSENQSRFITLNEAAKTVNISEQTIKKYQDLGLLQSFRINGQEQFREDEIRLIFNSKIKKAKSPTNKADSQSVNEPQKIIKEPTKPEPLKDKIEVSSKKSSKISLKSEHEEPPTLEDILKETESEESEKSSTVFKTDNKEKERTTQNRAESNIINSEVFNQPDEIEIPSIELLELTRTLKDQLESIKEERNWLRRRVEKLESSIEREQMITISKDETLRNLISHNNPTDKRPWIFRLPWFSK